MMGFADSPEHVARLFHSWMSGGFDRSLERELVERLRPHRGTWLVDGDFIFSLCKISDYRDDVIRWHKRPMNLERDRSTTDGNEIRSAPAVAHAGA